MPLSLFLLGATGYLGGTVLTHLEALSEYELTSLVRPGKEHLLQARRTKVITGTFSDLELIEKTAQASDIVINAADSDDLALTRAINSGLARGRREEWKKGVLVHVSGVQVIESGPSGELGCWPVFDDSNIKQIRSIPNTSLHRLIDLEVANADLAGYITASIICPGNIFGKGSGPDKVYSSIFPSLIKRALAAQAVYYAGEGTNVWAHVDVDDTADLIILSLQHNLSNPSPESMGPPTAGFGRFYFAENGEHEKQQLCRTVASLLASRQYLPASASEPISVPLGDPRAPQHVQKTTAQCISSRGRKELGWAPKVRLEGVVEKEFIGLAKAFSRTGA